MLTGLRYHAALRCVALFIVAQRQFEILKAVAGDVVLRNYSPTTANAEEPIRIVGSAAHRIPIAYQTDRKSFPFRSGLWLPGDYGSTPRLRKFAHDYVFGRDDETSP